MMVSMVRAVSMVRSPRRGALTPLSEPGGLCICSYRNIVESGLRKNLARAADGRVAVARSLEGCYAEK
jgi:hypothetical protein